MLGQRQSIVDLSSFDDIDRIIRNHRALTHPLFPYIAKAGRNGLTAQQFEIYRCNFFFRTFNTIPSVARLVIAAAKNLDMDTLAAAGKNLYEESGSGNPKRAHSYLLQESHNIHANTVFGLPKMTLAESATCDLLLPEVRVYQQTIEELYNSNNYGIVLGAAYAHEQAANHMLINFYESLFVSYKEHYTLTDFYAMTEYFLSHICGVESDHATDAKSAAQRLAVDDQSVRYLLEGVLGFLSAQALLWDGLQREITAAANIGKRIYVDKVCNF